MTDEDFKIGDLVYVVRDCYVFNFVGQRAKISKTGDFGIIVQTDAPEIPKDDFLMHQFWQNSVKIQVYGERGYIASQLKHQNKK